MAKIRKLSRSHIIYAGLNQFKNAPEGFRMDPKDVPGLRKLIYRSRQTLKHN